MISFNILKKVQRHGFSGSAKIILQRFLRRAGYYEWHCRNAPRYANPTNAELLEVEQTLEESGINIQDYYPATDDFANFKAAGYFPSDYYEGVQSNVRDEKLLEHWIVAERLGLFAYEKDDIYVDVAACGSPWAQVLHSKHEVQAYAIDLVVPPVFSTLDFYRKENAIKTSFPDSSVRGMSLQCAFEMFQKQDDVDFISEIRRVLKPGGKVVILPLYMHTHHCAYATPEFFGRGHSDADAKEYVHIGAWGVPSSRKYSAVTLKERLLNTISQEGLDYEIFVLRNKEKFGDGVYCHFILEIKKTGRE